MLVRRLKRQETSSRGRRIHRGSHNKKHRTQPKSKPSKLQLRRSRKLPSLEPVEPQREASLLRELLDPEEEPHQHEVHLRARQEGEAADEFLFSHVMTR